MMSNGSKTQHVIGAFIITCDTHTDHSGRLAGLAGLASLAG